MALSALWDGYESCNADKSNTQTITRPTERDEEIRIMSLSPLLSPHENFR